MTNITAEVEAWVKDEIRQQRLGEEFGVAVTFGPAQVQTPQGVVQVPGWMLLLTARNPLLTEGPLYHGPVPIGAPRPVEDAVRAEVVKGLAALRDLAASKLAGGNGRPAVIAPA
jgi:hypothetical protein